MSAQTQVSPDPLQPAQRHRHWGWIVVCLVLLLAVIGLGIWALSLQSDLDS